LFASISKDNDSRTASKDFATSMPSGTNLQQLSYDVMYSTSNPTKITSDVGYPLQVVSYASSGGWLITSLT